MEEFNKLNILQKRKMAIEDLVNIMLIIEYIAITIMRN